MVVTIDIDIYNTKHNEDEMRNYLLLLIPLFLIGCVYMSKNLISVKGDEVDSPFGMTKIHGSNIEVLFNREMELRVFK